ncbi:uncharacterized mitochondrial protein AtMg00810-like [Vigna angularis]|uniref:uncharacterized mitochondrial protein AtMg00810-like n=1 Tax=Phaseolus angularis TaxID=3914 RepID=UPI000809DD5F|nr:uncharacterized mitochondrial protein AtMg00810-like [Vigna angularis]
MDVKSAFLNGYIKEEVFVEQPLGFQDFDFPDHVFKLKKALYGLKQAPRSWYERLRLQVKQDDSGIFIHQSKYGTDLLKKYKMLECKEAATPMATNYYLGLDEKGNFVDQKLYRGMIRSLLYLTTSRPDIMHSVCLCARFQSKPKESHLTAVKRILKYLKGTKSLGLWYPSGLNIFLEGYSDSDFGGCKLDRKSISGTCHLLG